MTRRWCVGPIQLQGFNHCSEATKVLVDPLRLANEALRFAPRGEWRYGEAGVPEDTTPAT